MKAPPVATGDTDTAIEAGSAVTGNILTNDLVEDTPVSVTAAEDDDGDTITIGAAFTTDAGGSLTINSDGTYSYTPPAQGDVPPGGLTEVFTYTITDADGDTDQATLTISVNDNDLLPDAVADTDTAVEDGTAVNGDLLANDDEGDAPTTVTAAEDDDGDTITIGAAFTTDAGGSLTINSDGTYSYTPPAQGDVPPGGLTEVFTYTITDADGDTDQATLTISVNDNDLLPDAVADTDTAVEDGTAVNGDLLANDDEGDAPTTVTAAEDDDGDTITIGAAFTTDAGGSLTINSDGTYSYTPPAQGDVPPGGLTEVFTYTITDADGDTDQATLTISVNDNDLLPDAVADTDTAVEAGTAVNGDLLANDDEGDAPTTVTAAEDDDGDTITIGAAFTTDAGGSLTINSDGTYSYTPPAQGDVPPGGLTEVFTYTITDADGDTDQATLTISVNDNDLLPDAVADTDTAVEAGTAVNGDLLANDDEGDAPTTVTAAEDDDGDTITIGAAFTTDAGGSLTINSDGTYSYTPPAQGDVPPGGLTEVFTYTITDADGDTDQATLTITVNDNDLLPDAVADTDTAVEDGTAVNGDLLANDDEGDAPTTVTAAEDDDGDTITIGAAFTTDAGGSLTINSDGTYSYTPPAQGDVPPGGLTEVFTYTITDADGDTDQATLTISVDNRDDNAPLIDNDSVTIPENLANSSVVYDVNDAVTGTDLDPDSDAITYSIIAGNSAGAFDIDTSTGVITVIDSSKLDAETSTSFALTVQASAGASTDTAVITINLLDVEEHASVVSGTFTGSVTEGNPETQKPLAVP